MKIEVKKRKNKLFLELEDDEMITLFIKQLVEKQIVVRKEVLLLFIDLKKAYGNITLITVWKAL
jgi:hypothetical protein